MKYPLVLKAYNLYHLLGLENYASGEQIKKRYWQLARKYHPDRVESTEEETQRLDFILETESGKYIGEFLHIQTNGLKFVSSDLKRFKKIKKEDWVFTNWRSHYHLLLKTQDEKLSYKLIIRGSSMYPCSKRHKVFYPRMFNNKKNKNLLC